MNRDVLQAVRDPERLVALSRTGLLDTDPEEPFDHLTRIAGRLLDAPLALVNLIDADRQFSKSCYAPPSWGGTRDTPLRDSFCKYVVHTGEPVLIEDTHLDPRVASTATVTELGIRAYVGIPLTSPDGDVLGALCVADFRPRGWEREQVEMLREVTALVSGEIRLRSEAREARETHRLTALADRERREKTVLLESALEGIYGTDQHGDCTFLNPAGAAILGCEPSEAVGRNMHRLIHHTREDGSAYPEAECPMHRTLSERLSIRVADERFWRMDGTSFPVEYSSSPIMAGDEVRGAVVTFSDMTQRRRKEEVQRFLSRASSVLAASSLDYSATLRSLAHLAVPVLGDWCTVYITGAGGALERLEIAHADPARREIVEALRRYPVKQTPAHPAVQVMGTGESLLMKTIPAATLDAVAQDAEHREILRTLGASSAVVVPLRARGRTLGALALSAGESRLGYTEEDLTIAEEFAHRAAMAVDNARLFQKSQEANRAKADFLATISHELRTPLNAVTGYADLLRQGIPEPLPARSLEYVDRIHLSARHLIQLIEEVLSFSGLEAGRASVSMRTVAVAELIPEIRAVIEPLAEQKGLRLVTDAPLEPLNLRTDAGKLRQILLNLLDNAVKFTDSGEVGFAARALGGSVVFEVRDTGIGIRAEDGEAIFEPFRQAEQSTTRSAGGTGLGLTVVHRLTELLGGRLSFTSAPGVGTTFSVEFPVGE